MYPPRYLHPQQAAQQGRLLETSIEMTFSKHRFALKWSVSPNPGKSRVSVPDPPDPQLV